MRQPTTPCRDPGSAISHGCQRRPGTAAIVLTGLALPFLAGLPGCTTVRIESAAHEVHIERHWGVLAVSLSEPEASHVAEVTGLGLVRSPWGWSAGYTHQTWAALGPQCRLVIWASTPDHLETAARLADPKAGICVVHPSPVEAEAKHHAD